MKVLIVDDSKPILSMVTEMLTGLGHESLTAENGKIAMEVIEKNSIDLVLLDWNMPEMTGLEFLEENTKSSFCKAPVVMMTTENSPEKIGKALESGAVEYIMKPFTSDILENKIEFVKEMFL